MQQKKTDLKTELEPIQEVDESGLLSNSGLKEKDPLNNIDYGRETKAKTPSSLIIDEKKFDDINDLLLFLRSVIE